MPRTYNTRNRPKTCKCGAKIVGHPKKIGVCNKCYMLQWNANNKERTLIQYRPTKKAWNLKKNYGLSLDEFLEMALNQRGKCKICNNREQQVNSLSEIDGMTQAVMLSVDHNHKTGKIRGLLCSKCNRGLGFFRDNPDLLRTAAAYIEEYDNE